MSPRPRAALFATVAAGRERLLHPTKKIGMQEQYGTANITKVGIERIPTKVNLDGLKRNMSWGNSLSDELELSSVLGDTTVSYTHLTLPTTPYV